MNTRVGEERRPRGPRAAIHRVAQEIVRYSHPRKVILFGSHAYGKPTRDSDVDFLVILETQKRNMEQALDISRAVSHPFPMDIVVMKPREVTQRLKGGDLVLREMVTRGKVLYETGHSSLAAKS